MFVTHIWLEFCKFPLPSVLHQWPWIWLSAVNIADVKTVIICQLCMLRWLFLFRYHKLSIPFLLIFPLFKGFWHHSKTFTLKNLYYILLYFQFCFDQVFGDVLVIMQLKIFHLHLQSTLPKSNSHKSNNRPSRRSIQVLFSLYYIVFYPT